MTRTTTQKQKPGERKQGREKGEVKKGNGDVTQQEGKRRCKDDLELERKTRGLRDGVRVY